MSKLEQVKIEHGLSQARIMEGHRSVPKDRTPMVIRIGRFLVRSSTRNGTCEVGIPAYCLVGS